MKNNNREVVNDFIEEIWNQREFRKLDEFFHPKFVDHSLPATLPPNLKGLQLWIKATSKAFENKTIIEEMVCEDEKVMVKIKMVMKHIGLWRAVEPTGTKVVANGFRYFKFSENKIIEHWALIDGTAIENQLKEAHHGCKIQ